MAEYNVALSPLVFMDELKAAGLGALPLSVSKDGIEAGWGGLTTLQRNAVQTVIAAHNAAKVAAAPVPAEVPLFKARFIMARTPRGSGTLLTAVKAAIAAIPDEAERSLASEALEYANTLSRNGRLVTMLAPALGLSDADLDALFRTAAAIKA